MHDIEIKGQAFTDAAKQAVRNRGGLAPWRINKVKAFVETHLSRPIRVGELAQEVRLSVTHFSRAFAHSFGEPPITYMRRQRLTRAQYLMTTTNARLAAIAVECGFPDQAGFGNTFKQTFGQTPANWRRQIKEAAAEAFGVPDADASHSSAAASTPDGKRRLGAPNPEHRP
jgi:AraC family transcriptional regulator